MEIQSNGNTVQCNSSSTATATTTAIPSDQPIPNEVRTANEVSNQPSQNRATARMFQGTRLLLTYPQCQTPKERVLQNLEHLKMELDVAVRFYVIAEETHENGDLHLHVLLGLGDRMRLSAKRVHSALDKLVISEAHPEGKHGNYQTVKSLPKALVYVCKEKRYLINGIEPPKDSESEREAKRKRTEEVVQQLWSGAPPSQVMEQYTTFYFAQRKKILEFAQDVRLRNLSLEKLDPVVNMKIKSPTNRNYSVCSLMQWLKSNIVDGVRKKRAPRQKQLWLHGPPRIGKSRLLSLLSQRLRIYEIPTEDWYDQYQDDAYDLAILDEFTGQKPIWWLNRWLDGNSFHLKQRNSPGTNKKFNIPTIIVSNYHPESVFTSTKTTGSIQGLIDRLDIVYIEEPFELEYADEQDERSEVREEIIQREERSQNNNNNQVFDIPDDFVDLT